MLRLVPLTLYTRTLSSLSFREPNVEAKGNAAAEACSIIWWVDRLIYAFSMWQDVGCARATITTRLFCHTGGQRWRCGFIYLRHWCLTQPRLSNDRHRVNKLNWCVSCRVRDPVSFERKSCANVRGNDRMRQILLRQFSRWYLFIFFSHVSNRVDWHRFVRCSPADYTSQVIIIIIAASAHNE